MNMSDTFFHFQLLTMFNRSISNGLALSPTFHRAFDRDLIAISDNYRVLVQDYSDWCCSINEFYSPAELQSAGEYPTNGSMKTRSFTCRPLSGFILR
jgi:hypothetical protein